MLIIDLIGECGEARKTICTPEWCQSVSVREAKASEADPRLQVARPGFPLWRGKTSEPPPEIR